MNIQGRRNLFKEQRNKVAHVNMLFKKQFYLEVFRYEIFQNKPQRNYLLSLCMYALLCLQMISSSFRNHCEGKYAPIFLKASRILKNQDPLRDYLFFTKGTIMNTILPEKYFIYIYYIYNYQTILIIFWSSDIYIRTQSMYILLEGIKLYDININLDCWSYEKSLQRDF